MDEGIYRLEQKVKNTIGFSGFLCCVFTATFLSLVLYKSMYIVSVKLGNCNDRIITDRFAQMIAGAVFTYY